jgi:hypothetical protein
LGVVLRIDVLLAEAGDTLAWVGICMLSWIGEWDMELVSNHARAAAFG